MRFIYSQLLAACTAMCLSAGLYADSAAEGVQVQGAYVRAVPPGQTNSAAFLSLTNKDDADHALVAAESGIAKSVELHTHLMEEGMMKMRQVEKIDLPAGKTMNLAPGGLHVMLIDLTQQLSPGDNVEMTLVFDDGSRAELTAPVKTVQEMMEHHHH